MRIAQKSFGFDANATLLHFTDSLCTAAPSPPEKEGREGEERGGEGRGRLYTGYFTENLKTSSGRCRINMGYLPFTWKTRKFQLENQMVRIIPFGELLKLWASGQSDAFLLLLLGFTADVHRFCMLSVFC